MLQEDPATFLELRGSLHLKLFDPAAIPERFSEQRRHPPTSLVWMVNLILPFLTCPSYLEALQHFLLHRLVGAQGGGSLSVEEEAPAAWSKTAFMDPFGPSKWSAKIVLRNTGETTRRLVSRLVSR